MREFPKPRKITPSVLLPQTPGQRGMASGHFGCMDGAAPGGARSLLSNGAVMAAVNEIAGAFYPFWRDRRGWECRD
jgi:hypothetical protein